MFLHWRQRMARICPKHHILVVQYLMRLIIILTTTHTHTRLRHTAISDNYTCRLETPLGLVQQKAKYLQTGTVGFIEAVYLTRRQSDLVEDVQCQHRDVGGLERRQIVVRAQ